MADVAPSAPAPPNPSRGASLRARAVVLGFAVIALILAWEWYDTRSQLAALNEDVALRLRESDAASRDAVLLARQAQDAMRETQARLAQAEVRLAESQSRQTALEAVYQELSRNRDDWLLAETEQILTIASEQLQLAGNVKTALAALQTADARLARSGRDRFVLLRKALASDIGKLKAASGTDLPAMAAKLDQLIAGADSLPLVQEARPAASAKPAASSEEAGFWTKFTDEVLEDLKRMVRVENVGRIEPVLLSPSQTFFLRENLKLRLLNARLALLARDEATFRADMKTAAGWLERYFDTRSRAATGALATVRQLGSQSGAITLPSIDESLAAVHGYKTSRGRAAQ